LRILRRVYEEVHLKTILIVEDIELNIDLLTQILEDDYNLIIARDGAQGVALTKQEVPDLILMDISLPVMDRTLLANR
jgi:CheY-like chemotaxis protein